jgi:hypothetical protein
MQVGIGFFSPTLRLVEIQWRVVHMISLRRLRWVQIEDGQVDATDYIGPFYLRIIVFYVLDLMDIVVFYLSL